MTTTEFGQAVHRWRDRVSPEAAGLPAGGHWRAAGLRREELALLAGISVDYITRLEQGRASNPSAQVVEALEAYGAQQAFISEVIRQANGISGLARLYTSQGQGLPVSRSKLGEEVARLRNLAAHAGQHPDRLQVETAIAHAKKIVRSIAPLPVA